MAFSPETVKKAFARSGGRCECDRKAHTWHSLRCPKILTEAQRGTEWEAHHKISVDAGGTDTFDNCEILCMRCHNAIPK
ncbi:HNH endonuclease [Candidatus Bipolaricaulota bacterium]|nr:HNH endonuclease [Candidatus Bipolaricaulota bacterium]